MKHLSAVLFLAAALALPARSDVLAWIPTSLSGVDVVDLQVDPHDPSRVWAGSAAGGISLSTDGGASFASVPVALPATTLRNLAIDPGDPSRLYASTDQGLFRLEADGTWSRLRPPSRTGRAEFVAVDPSAPGTIVVTAGLDRLERSTDCGATWTATWNGSMSEMAWQVVFDPSGSGVVLAPTSSSRLEYDYGLLLSTDHGATWTEHRSNGLDFVTFDPFGSGAVYAIQFSYFDRRVPSHVVSRDRGLTWESFAPSSEDARGPLAILRSGTVLAAGSGGVFRTDGAGSPWVAATVGVPRGEPRRLAALDPDGTSLLLATSKGVFRTVHAPDPVLRTTFLPVVVDAFGERGTRFKTSVALFNASDGMAEGTLTYIAAGSVGATGSGSVPLRLRAGEQLDGRDVTDYLRRVGLAIPEPTPGQPQVGTLSARTSDGLWGGQVVALARVSTPSGPGSSGTGLWSLPSSGFLSVPSYLPGLRQNSGERTNVAAANAGDEGTIRVRVSFLFAGGRTSREAELGPGQWAQWNAPLAEIGAEVADAVVERIDGNEPYVAYATIVDNVTGDGSYLPARALPPEGPQWIPAVVESGGFETEVVLHNPGDVAVTASLAFTDSLDTPASSPGPLGSLLVSLSPRGTVAIPRFVEALRSAGIAVGARTVSHAGTVLVGASEAGGPSRPVLAWARTSIPGAAGGAYGVAYPSLAAPELALTEAWIAGVTTDYSGSRANLALLNPGTGPVTLEWRAFSGVAEGFDTGFGGTVELGPGGWHQEALDVSRLGVNVTVRIRKVTGQGPFAAYGVVNDGAKPGQGTGDGSYLPMVAVR